MPNMQNYTIEFRAMGSHIQAWLSVPTVAQAEILNEVPRWFESWEARFSRFRETSELSRLNQVTGRWTQVSAEMGEVITLALRAAQSTDGLFNPLILPALEAIGYDHDFTGADFQPGSGLKQWPGAVTVADWYLIEWDSKRQRIRLPAFARLDLGGIVKGWAAQRAAERLAESGPCLVDAAGDMAAFGSPDDSGGWQVGIAPETKADGQSEIARYLVNLRDQGIATSGIDYRRWLQNGRPVHHLIDPRTSQPVKNDILSATVIAPDTIQAETWAKAALIAGNDEAASRAGNAVLFVHTDQSIRWNTAFEKHYLAAKPKALA